MGVPSCMKLLLQSNLCNSGIQLHGRNRWVKTLTKPLLLEVEDSLILGGTLPISQLHNGPTMVKGQMLGMENLLFFV